MSDRLRFLADEDFDNDVVRGLLQRSPELDIVRVQDVGLGGAEDPTILEWAAQERRVVLTHDVTTMKPFAYSRVARGLPMSGVFVVSQTRPIGLVIEHLLLLVECSLEGEWGGRVRHVPM